MIGEYMNKKSLKDERARIRIKEQVLNIYEKKTLENFEEKDPNFNNFFSTRSLYTLRDSRL